MSDCRTECEQYLKKLRITLDELEKNGRNNPKEYILLTKLFYKRIRHICNNICNNNTDCDHKDVINYWSDKIINFYRSSHNPSFITLFEKISTIIYNSNHQLLTE